VPLQSQLEEAETSPEDTLDELKGFAEVAPARIQYGPTDGLAGGVEEGANSRAAK
jgi:hypothetical protein